MNDFLKEWIREKKYFDMLQLMAKLSNLFSESDIPFIHYRVTENLFCKYYDAENLSRTDTAYDARINNIGVGIKTFQLKNDHSTEKIAEFNALAPTLKILKKEELAHKLAQYRNDRMQLANNLYNIDTPIYHIIGRNRGELKIFNSPYDFVDINNIRDIEENNASLSFYDGKHKYRFNKSKSVLMKDFIAPDKSKIIPVSIINDPYALLEQLLNKNINIENEDIKVDARPKIILPLYSTSAKTNGAKKNIYGKFVPLKSGLNQWNADGRKRDPNEVYIPYPAQLRKEQPDFFPPRDTPFTLRLPDGTNISAKVCQENGKAIMSNPNKDLGEWILRKILKLSVNELLTINKLDSAGFDTLIFYKNAELNYSVDVLYSSK